jgi:hypothetical protein
VIEYITSGRAVDVILGLMAAEGLVLGLLWRLGSRGVPPLPLLANLTSGACLLLALRGALTGAGPLWIGGFLGVALVGHLLELGLRWRSPGRAGS